MGRIFTELISDPFVFVTYYFWKYLWYLDCRLTKWFLIHWSKPASIVSILLSSTKSFKRENIFEILPSSFLTHKPNFRIHAFILSVFPVIHWFNLLNFSKTLMKQAICVETIFFCWSIEYLLDLPTLKIALRLLASCKHEPQRVLLTAKENYVQ